MRDQRVKRLSHVTIPQVPRRDLLQEHRAVVRLGVLDQSGILLGVERFFFRWAAIPSRVIHCAPLELDELGDDLVLARAGEAGPGDEPVDLGVVAEVIEASVARPCLLRRLGIDFLEKADDRVHRGVEAVALMIELVRPVRRLAEQDEPRIADQVHQRVVCVAGTGQRARDLADRLRECDAGGIRHRASP
jgi:hypothetical protein